MSLALCILASGSAGNCSVLRAPGGNVLIDAGIGPRTLAGRLAGTGVALGDISAIVLTHLDSDHFRPHWCAEVLRRRIAVWTHDARAEDLLCGHPEELRTLVRGFEADRPFSPVPGVTFDPIRLAHDEDGSHGFLIAGHGNRIGFATDLGRVPKQLIERFYMLDVLALESNYDAELQDCSDRPWFLKQRITGGRGHLSNDEAFAAARAIFDRHERAANELPHHVVLLHRSRQCNCPDRLRATFAKDARLTARLVLSEQQTRTEWLEAFVPDSAHRWKTMLF